MRLLKLDIRALPGIEPGFVFEPPDAGVNIVSGPNAIGKSSLARALGHLLAADRSDPPALSLEAEFEGLDARRWQVRRNGGQILWRCNGEAASRPALPSADQIGRYRLSIETLLDDDDASDGALAQRLRLELHGNFDLAALEPGLGSRFARREARALDDARRARRAVESEHAALRRSEAELPDLERRIEEAREARARCESLEQALRLADAVDTRKRAEAALARFPPDMARLRGDEAQRLERAEDRLRALREEARERRRVRAEAEAALEATGLAHSRPSSETIQALGAKLRALERLRSERASARELLVRADAEMRDALARFNDAGTPPRLDADSFRRADALAPPLIAAQARLRELREQLSLAGEAPEESEIEGQREAAEALRAWLAANAVTGARAGGGSKSAWVAICIALTAAVLAALAAFAQGAFLALAGAVAALLASGFALFLRRAPAAGASSPKDEAERRFRETGVEAPPRWQEESVRRHLRERVETRLNQLVSQRQRAAGRERIALQIEETEEERAALEAERAAIASEIGFDPAQPVLEFHRFVHRCSAWDEARARHAEQSAALAQVEADIAGVAREVRDALAPWRSQDAPSPARISPHPSAADADHEALTGRTPSRRLDTGSATPPASLESGAQSPRRLDTLATKAGEERGPDSEAERPDVDLLHGAFDALQRRIEEAVAARSDIRNCDTALDSLARRMSEVEEEVEGLFVQAGIEPGATSELGERIERLEPWKEARGALERAKTEEDLMRAGLAEHRDLLALVDEVRREEMQGERAALERRADEHTALIEQRAEIQTRLEDAGRNLALEGAAAAESRAEQVLADKHEAALFAAATETLLEDVKREYVAEHEPAVLRRAREIFARVTAHAFELELRPDGSFAARDVRQGVTRPLGELSSGTRAQLLLALRLAWTAAQEAGGEALPLFLDEALTTSDEDRFAVMARSLERIATDEERPRQVFYLSARRHESALWKRATGSEPATIDLASLRFRRPAATPEDYRIGEVPSLPAPEGHRAETYARLLEVPPLDPERPAGSLHLFHLLRDDLPLLYSLMDTWRILSLGQLEALLASDAAPAALGGEDACDRLRRRGRAARTWIGLWRQGRGRRVDRGVLEQCDSVSAVFVDRVAELAEHVRGDGEALVRALRDGRIPHFRTSKIHELERELIDEGRIDLRERLDGEARRRLTLPQAGPRSQSEADDLNRVLGWLEAAADCGFPLARE